MNSRIVTLEGLENVRDLGGVAVYGGRRVRSGLLYRGGALAKMTAADERELFVVRGIGCVVDLRCGWELEARPDRVPEGVEYHHLPYFDNDIVGVEYVRPVAGTRMVGHDFACDPLDFYAAMANPLTVGQMGRALRVCLDSAIAGVPVYQHCSGGKDRAGILSALILLALGASYDEVFADYEMTNISRDAHYEENFQRFLQFTGDAEFAREITLAHRARPENLGVFFSAVKRNYGEPEQFLCGALGIDERLRAQAREACTA